MTRICLIIAALTALHLPLSALAHEHGKAAPEPTTAAAPTTAPAAPSTKPAPVVKPGPKLLATVGKTKIFDDELQNILATVPPGTPQERIDAFKIDYLTNKIKDVLMEEHMKSLPEATQEELEAFKKKILDANPRLADELKSRNMTLDQKAKEVGKSIVLPARKDAILTKLTSPTAVKKYIASRPERFDGSTVKASHILLKVAIYAATDEEKKAAADKLKQLAADIAVGKITFEEAAKGNSACSSSQKGGDLGDFTFDRMVQPFATKAFSMKVGEISGIVETRFGYHIIKVTGRKQGSGVVNLGSEDIAKRMIQQEWDRNAMAKSLKANPIKIMN